MKRFSLRALFVVCSLVVLFFGYAQYRRKSILSEARSLESEGVQVFLPKKWWTVVWMPTPSVAQLRADEAQEGKLAIGPGEYTLAEVDERVREIRNQLRSAGFRYLVVDSRKKNGAVNQISFDLDKSEEANNQFSLSTMVKRPPLSEEELNKLIKQQNAGRKPKPKQGGK